MAKIKIDLRDVFDDCYGGYEDQTAEIRLEYDRATRRWKNEQVEFWNDETLGWCYRKRNGKWNYGYDSLRDAVTRYCRGQAEAQNSDKEYIASRLADVEYRQKIRDTTLYCKTTVRCFLPEYNEARFTEKCEAVSQAINMSIGGMQF